MAAGKVVADQEVGTNWRRDSQCNSSIGIKGIVIVKLSNKSKPGNYTSKNED